MLHITQDRELQADDMLQEVLQGKALVCLGLIQRRRIGPAEIILCGGIIAYRLISRGFRHAYSNPTKGSGVFAARSYSFNYLTLQEICSFLR
jgi:hypothetical protein